MSSRQGFLGGPIVQRVGYGLHFLGSPARQVGVAAIDGSGPVKRFFDISLPLLSPTTFFLFIVNVNYTMFDTFSNRGCHDGRRSFPVH